MRRALVRSYYSQNCLAVGTQAALLAGFAYSGLTQVAIPLDSEYVLKLLYLLVTSAAMCLELIAVMSTTLLSMMGPGLALRGPDGSMHPAVDGMMEEYRSAYLNFLLGLIAFHFSAALFGWLTFNWVVSTFTSSCVLGSLYLLIRYAMRVHSRFRLPAGEVITGRFTGDEVLANMTGRAPVCSPRPHSTELHLAGASNPALPRTHPPRWLSTRAACVSRRWRRVRLVRPTAASRTSSPRSRCSWRRCRIKTERRGEMYVGPSRPVPGVCDS